MDQVGQSQLDYIVRGHAQHTSTRCTTHDIEYCQAHWICLLMVVFLLIVTIHCNERKTFVSCF